ncbi:MAG: hypothetical protein Q9208_007755 [Pyrenodesmia sp. 3 TL-2023]
MSCTVVSEAEIYSLAAKARTKFDRQLGAKDHSLRILVGHARLYDILDDRVQEIRIPRMSKADTPPQNRKTTPSVNQKKDSSINVRACHEKQYVSNGKITHSTNTMADLASDCVIVGDDQLLSSSSDPDLDTSVLVTESEDPKSHYSHGSPTIIRAPAAVNGNKTPGHTFATPHAIVSEMPIDDDYDSSSDSDSDSDVEPDLSFGTPSTKSQQIKAAPISILRPSTPHRNVHWDNDKAHLLKSSDAPIKVDSHQDQVYEDMPELERVPPAQQEPEHAISQATPATEMTCSKGAPLSPQLCEEILNDLPSTIHPTDELPEALQKILDATPNNKDAEATRRNIISRYFSALAFWSRRTRRGEDDDDFMDEKVR